MSDLFGKCLGISCAPRRNENQVLDTSQIEVQMPRRRDAAASWQAASEANARIPGDTEDLVVKLEDMQLAAETEFYSKVVDVANAEFRPNTVGCSAAVQLLDYLAKFWCARVLPRLAAWFQPVTSSDSDLFHFKLPVSQESLSPVGLF